MAYPIEATPVLRGEDAVKLIKSVINARPDPDKKIEAEKRAAFIKSLKKRGTSPDER